MVIQRKISKKAAVKASNARVAKKQIRANEEEEVVEDVEVTPEASDLLFEAEDVAQLVAEVTGEDVAVTVDEDAVVFEVGEDEYTVEAEGDEEILESTRKPLRNKKTVKASKKVVRRSAARK